MNYSPRLVCPLLLILHFWRIFAASSPHSIPIGLSRSELAEPCRCGVIASIVRLEISAVATTTHSEWIVGLGCSRRIVIVALLVERGTLI